jgi:hypothetical protein
MVGNQPCIRRREGNPVVRTRPASAYTAEQIRLAGNQSADTPAVVRSSAVVRPVGL